MCGIAGFCDFEKPLTCKTKTARRICEEMGHTLRHRGPDSFDTFVCENFACAHARLAVIDPDGGSQPMRRIVDGKEYVIVYNGELYNTNELKKELQQKGYSFTTTCDTEILLYAYIAFGEKVAEKLNGIFAFAVWDGFRHGVFLCRDRFGVKPLFYSFFDKRFLFASEIKAILAYPGKQAVIGTYGLCEIFGLGPARSPGCGVYEGIHEIQPGYCAYVDFSGIRCYPYFTLTAAEHKETYEQTVEHVRCLLTDAIKRQLVSDVPLCTLLSGGVDSSLISAVASSLLKKDGKRLSTYSFDYEDNSQYFKASSFQPSEDRPYVDIMVNALDTDHTYLYCNTQQLFDCLFEAVRAKDLPGMADVDSSMLHFAKGIKKHHTVCLSGECADEIFGGYPWFRDSEIYENKKFPWSKNFSFRCEVLNPELASCLPLKEYVACQYEKTMARVSYLDSDDTLQKRQREISYLNTSWFMTTLLDRKDRMTMASGLEVRVPFADHRLIQYLYNVPWEYKYHNQEVKALLRDAFSDYLPDEVLHRKKSPYPKTYHPGYESLLKAELSSIISDKEQPLCNLINKDYLKTLMNTPSDLGKPWFGQLMAVPQMYAYLIEINYWLKTYHIQLNFSSL